MRSGIPVLIAIAVGFIMALKFFFENSPVVYSLANELEAWGMVIAAMAVVLGLASLVRVNLRAIRRRQKDWPFKVVLLLGLFGEILFGLFEYHFGSPKARQGQDKSAFHWSFQYILTPLGATIFSLLAFFIASAAFRAFRARSFAATLLLLAGVIVMLGRVLWGNLLTGGLASDLQVWILNVPSLAGQRAIIIGAGIGIVSVCLRVLLGVERPYMR